MCFGRHQPRHVHRSLWVRPVLEHELCRALRGDAEPLTPEGYGVWVRCGCGARLQWVSPEDAEADLLRSTLLAFEN
jgi:hypothetical protein